MESNQVQKTAKKLGFVYYIVYFAAVLSATAGYYLTFKNNIFIDPQSSTGIALTSIFIIYIIGSIPLTLGGFNMLSKKWIALEDINEKLLKYQKGATLRLLIIGISIAIGVFLFYLTHSQSMIFCAGIAAIALFFCKPTELKIISELKLDETED